jgi:hypothetical protein
MMGLLILFLACLKIGLIILVTVLSLQYRQTERQRRRYRYNFESLDDEPDAHERRPRRQPALPARESDRRWPAEDGDEDRRPAVANASSTLAWVLVGVFTFGAFVIVVLGALAVWIFVAMVNPSAPVAASPPPPPNQGKPWQPDAGKPEPPRLKLPPLPEALDIHQGPVAKAEVLTLPGRAGTVVAGGGGRFLVMTFPQRKEVGVFDVNEARLTHVLAVDEGDCHIAAGMNKLLVLYPAKGELLRFDLLTGAVEERRPFAVQKVSAFCMGSASAGPLLVCDASDARLVDIVSFDTEILPGTKGSGHFPTDSYWAAANGRVFGRSGNHGQPNGIGVMKLREDGPPDYRREHESAFFVVPGPDGRRVYAGGHGVLTDLATGTPDAVVSRPKNGGNIRDTCLPAHHGPFYLHLHTKFGDVPGVKPVSPGDPTHGVTIYKLGDPQPLAQLTSVGLMTYKEMTDTKGGLRLEQTVHLVPRAGLLIVLPVTGDRLHLTPVRLDGGEDAKK